jgi:hypothetical protein
MLIPESVQLAVIVALPGVISPIILAWLVNRGKKQDWARQDRVAEQAAKAAELLLERQDAVAAKAEAVASKAAEAAKLLLAANERVATTTSLTNGKLDGLQSLAETTHALVNSNMTASMQAELNATVREVAGLKEILALKGTKPSIESLAAIETAQNRISELQAVLADRLKI